MARAVGGRGPANIMKHMKGIHFPATKSEIVDIAKKAQGVDTDMVVEVLGKLPDQEYSSLPEILKQVGKINK